MRSLFGSLLATCAILASTGASLAQGRVVYEGWPIYQDVIRQLPPGFHDFVPFARALPSDYLDSSASNVVLCREMGNAISYGMRIGKGYSPLQAVQEMQAIRGSRDCGFVRNLSLQPIAVAVRGPDRYTPIAVVRWADQFGRLHYTGVPR